LEESFEGKDKISDVGEKIKTDRRFKNGRGSCRVGKTTGTDKEGTSLQLGEEGRGLVQRGNGLLGINNFKIDPVTSVFRRSLKVSNCYCF